MKGGELNAVPRPNDQKTVPNQRLPKAPLVKKGNEERQARRRGTVADVVSSIKQDSNGEMDVAAAEQKFRDYCLAARQPQHLEAEMPGINFAVSVAGIPIRSRIRPADDYKYLSFGPPAYFEAPYVICRLTMDKEVTKWLSHLGEELLTLVHDSEADLKYEFHRQGGHPTSVTVRKNELIRISPSQLHRNRVVGSGKSAVGWFILRPDNRNVGSIFYESRKKDKEDTADRIRRLEEKEPGYLSEARHLLLASGILEKLRDHRRGAGYQPDELSRLTGLNRFYIQRLQTLPWSKNSKDPKHDKANFAVEAIWKIAQEIDVNPWEMLRNLAWTSHKQNLDWDLPASEPARLAAPTAIQHHLLHPELLCLQPGVPWTEALDARTSDMISLIVMDGQMVVENLGDPRDSSPSPVHMLSAGFVFHGRNGHSFRCIATTSPVKVLIIRCSDRCTCVKTVPR